MVVQFGYFAAPSDADAAGAVDRPLGPAEPVSRPGGFLSGWRRDDDDGTTTSGEAFPTVLDTGIDPVAQCGTLEALLTGRHYDQVTEDPRWGQTLVTSEGGERLVGTVTDHLVDALARATPEDLSAVAGPWSRTEEFDGAGDPDVLAAVLGELSDLAVSARLRGWNLYSWTSI